MHGSGEWAVEKYPGSQGWQIGSDVVGEVTTPWPGSHPQSDAEAEPILFWVVSVSGQGVQIPPDSAVAVT